MSIETFEFCIQEFGFSTSIEKTINNIESVVPEIYEKYSVDNYVPDNHFVTNLGDDEMKSAIIKNMIRNNEDGILKYLKRNDFAYVQPLYKKNKSMHLYEYIALYAGHLKLFLKIFKILRPQHFLGEYHQIVSIGLLRHNHVAQYKDYLQMIPAYCRKQIIRVPEIFISDTDYLSNMIDQPKTRISKETFDFCVQNFGFKHVSLMPNAYYEKYLANRDI